tara:strand:- start:648 stop:863 length:216 start_codon:yes stop_codon:yes gene_type:complete
VDLKRENTNNCGLKEITKTGKETDFMRLTTKTVNYLIKVVIKTIKKQGHHIMEICPTARNNQSLPISFLEL